MPPQLSGTVVQDLENALHHWFSGKGVDWVLIRPDRFVAAVGTCAEAERELGGFCADVLPEWRSDPAPAQAAA